MADNRSSPAAFVCSAQRWNAGPVLKVHRSEQHQPRGEWKRYIFVLIELYQERRGKEKDILDEETDGVAEVTIEVARSGCTELFSPGLSPRNPLKM